MYLHWIACMICSMTAFARCERKCVWGNISWEIRSLNQRYLDIYIDMPKYLYGYSCDIRKKIKDCLFRGKIDCFLNLEVDNAVVSEFSINEQLLRRLIMSAEWIKNQTKEGKINPLLILSWPGVVVYKKNNVTDINLILLECFEETLHCLIKDREREGAFLKDRIVERLYCMRETVDKMHSCLSSVLDMQRKKLLGRVKDICACVDDVRLEQELLIVVQKIDISEEIDRLICHIEEACRVMEEVGPVGRRLDFISQELCREVNTISAKSIDVGITHLAIFLKVLIEQMREQVQNIE